MKTKAKEHTRIMWNTVQPKEITWLWPGRLPFGKISILSGNSRLGKTMIAEVYKACAEAGISSRTVERAKKDLDIRSGRDGNKRIWIFERV